MQKLANTQRDIIFRTKKNMQKLANTQRDIMNQI